ncbi:hypothetical protein [Candidatus Nanohalococcus occultus]|uniref:hypothetical protein n=1 Tax=Candidatus Nanohalococcus occultus TaxID=2978047 RepID=UPI0039DF8EB2
MSDRKTGAEEIIQASSILEGRERSRTYLEANSHYLSENYPGKTVVAVTSEGSTEIAGIYRSESRNWRRVLEMIEETYSEQAVHTAVARKME